MSLAAASRVADPGAGPAITIRGLRKRYGDRLVVDGLDLTVERGEVLALLGPNGAGKTTTVEILEGYRRADGGEVRVLGLDPQRDAAALRPRLGLMLQSGGVYQYGRPQELLRLFASFYREPLDPDALLEQVGLGAVATRAYRTLSGGERQRLALGLALVGRPEAVILDEPTAGMDPAARAQTRGLIAGLRQSGVTALITTHDLGDVEALADRVVIIAAGRVLAEGTPASLAGSDDPDLVVTLRSAADTGRAREPAGRRAGPCGGRERARRPGSGRNARSGPRGRHRRLGPDGRRGDRDARVGPCLARGALPRAGRAGGGRGRAGRPGGRVVTAREDAGTAATGVRPCRRSMASDGRGPDPAWSFGSPRADSRTSS